MPRPILFDTDIGNDGDADVASQLALRAPDCLARAAVVQADAARRVIVARLLGESTS